MEQYTLEDVTQLVEAVLSEEFRHGITTISTLGIVQRLQDYHDITWDRHLINDAIDVMMKRKYIRYAQVFRWSPMWYAEVTEGAYYEIRVASRINENWVPTWFDIYLEKLTEAREKRMDKGLK
jgi:hypothetical protein